MIVIVRNLNTSPPNQNCSKQNYEFNKGGGTPIKALPWVPTNLMMTLLAPPPPHPLKAQPWVCHCLSYNL